METVAFYSYKGGVGRTLLVANTARFLAQSGRECGCAFDLDLEAPGLHYKFDIPDTPVRSQGKLRGAVNELLDTLVNVPARSSLRQTAIEEEYTDTGESIVLIGSGFSAFTRILDSTRAVAEQLSGNSSARWRTPGGSS